MSTKVRPGIERWVAKATDEQRIALDEFTGCLDGTADSGGVYSTLEVLVDRYGVEYVNQVLSIMTLRFP